MSIPAGLGAATAPIEVIIDDGEPEDRGNYDEKGNLLSIEHDDGGVTVSINGAPLETAAAKEDVGWFDNLAESVPESELSRIAHELVRGIEDDIKSRLDWVESRAQGIRLLGLKLEIPGAQGETDGAPIEGMSKVRHPLLLEAVLRFQANARSELLPTDGPVKIRNDDNNATLEEDELANALERDLNHYLTSTASEYYPDTDRMLLMLGFGGTAFKKVYYCPLRQRPVSESVDAGDLIVNNEATDLANAKRVTHKIMMRPSVMRRMQILGVYRDVVLGTPLAPDLDAAQREKRDQEGVRDDAGHPDDRDREIYECYCELDIAGLEHKYKGKVSGLEVPYRVTIDVSSKEVLSIVRNYNEDTKELPVARKWFVKYQFVPGFGFYDIGLLHILGNTTNALTAAWREMLDNGMYANFPGFLVAKAASRQNTNIFRVPPGGGAQIETNGLPIQQAVMPLPYNAQGMAPLMALTSAMESTGQRVGGTSEMQVGEGRPDAPVGTTLAMIDQATKVLNAVHKRLHSGQAEEFRLLCGIFQENPESFWQRNFKPSTAWDEETFLKALEDYDLCPQADPNTASHGQRVMKIMGLKQLQAANPGMYDPKAIDTAALQAMGWSNPAQFFAPPSASATPPPEVMKDMMEAETSQTEAQARMMDAQTKAKEVDLKAQMGYYTRNQTHEAGAGGNSGGGAMNNENDAIMAQADMMDAQNRRAELILKAKQADTGVEQKEKDRASKEALERMDILKELVIHRDDSDIERAALAAARVAPKQG